MNEHEAATMLEERAKRVPVGTAPTDELVRRGRRRRALGRGLLAGVSAAAVAAVMAGAVAFDVWTANPPGDPARPPAAAQWQDVPAAAVVGAWRPVELMGREVPPDTAAAGELSIRATKLSAGLGGCRWMEGRYLLGPRGRFQVLRLNPVLGDCVGIETGFRRADLEAVIALAWRVQLDERRLLIRARDGRVLGAYEPAWAKVEPRDLRGRWRPVRLFGVDVRSIPQLTDGAWPPLVMFRAGRYSADDGVNDTFARYRLGPLGEFRDWERGSTLVGCIGKNNRPCVLVDNPKVLDEAVRFQVHDDLLVVYDDTGDRIGIYQRLR